MTESTTVKAVLINKIRSYDIGGAKPIMVCVGDSITRGQGSANWVNVLQSRHPDWRIVNAGTNGNLSWNIVERLDAIINLQPQTVTLMIGTNDIMAAENPRMAKRYRRQQNLPDIKPSLQWYEQNVDATLARLRSETDARILVFEIPILGEDLLSVQNAKVRIYNDALRRTCARYNVALLLLNSKLNGLLPKNVMPPLFQISVPLMLLSMASHYLGRSWDKVSVANGLSLLTDHVHLNDRAGRVVADLVEEHQGFLRVSS